MTTEPTAVQHAVETVESHLHPVASYDLADHPVPNGREEVWRFTPLKRTGGLLEGTPSDAHLKWELDAPASVTARELSTDDAIALGGTAPADRPAALAVAGSSGALLVDVPAETELDEPVVVRLVGGSADDTVLGHVVVRVGAHSRATVVLEHTGSARYAARCRCWSATARTSTSPRCSCGTTTRCTAATSAPGSAATHASGRSRPASAATWCGWSRRPSTTVPAARSSCSGSTSSTPASTSSTGCSSTTTPRTPAATSTTAAPCRARAPTRSGSATC